ncbi:SusC/RagA family TonB-linked outer membrane protein [Pontibacter sp. G13]|uniref:SusC/RagA family TonB-linked outer membrane protein n=1 Tax=Pontibacter sp. G13 TaxID=3074898 RepID=UPI00288B84C7|nr:SusC/RagA family TonB-linked outer membrane protein [Pontibacter sp. G13]WNJ20170.1 SusC/RagA family TonB-linked outer membrane protein [Pontibacter sp. G13]
MRSLFTLLCLMLLASPWALAQRTVTGTVSDETGPLVFASVTVKGTTIGVATDEEGKFSMEIPESAKFLVVRFVGYVSQELEIGDRSTFNITLEEDNLELDEVVVTAVGLETNRRALGYSIQNVDASEVIDAREVNLVDGLNGKVAGVTVVSASGSPGASSSIRVRGSTSINGSNSPLFVVDGVPIDNSTDGNGVGGVDQSNRAIDINPNDIEDITILKGAAASALYGVRAANGAVIITTKSGQSGKQQINVSFAYTADQVNKLPGRQFSYSQGRPTDIDPDPDVVNLQLVHNGPETGEGFSWGPALSELEYDGDESYQYDLNGRLVPKGTGNGVPANAYDPYTFFKTGRTLDMNASVSGGTNRISYYLSGGRLDQAGIVPNSTFIRNTFKTKIDATITDRLTAGISANFVNSGGSRIQRGSNIRGVMLGLLRTTPSFDNGNGLVGQAGADDVDTYVAADGTQRSYRAGIYDNPFWTVNKNPSWDDVNRLIGYATLAYKATDWLKFSYKLGIDHFGDRRNGGIDINPGRSVGSVFQSYRSSSDLNSDFLVMLDPNLGDDLSLNAVLGHNYYSTRVITQETEGSTLSSPNFYHISNATDVQGFEDVSQKEITAAYATVDLGYKDYLFLNLTGRNDWSSTLPEEANNFTSYSASLGFAFTEALGMQENPILPYGKIRLSYGKVGNDAPIFSTTSYYESAAAGGDGFITVASFPAFGLNSFERSTILGNSNLRPEKTTTFEVGAELKLFKGRMGVDVTYFDQKSVDQVLAVQISGAAGYTSIVDNAGSITNKGVEMVLSGTPIENRDFSWDISVNFTAMENTVDSLAPGIEEIGLNGFTSTSSRVVAGQPYGAIFGQGFQRTEAGDLLIGENGFPITDPTSKVFGDPNPDWVAGIRNTFSYKGLSLSVLFDIRQGGDMWCGTCGIMNYFGTSDVSGEMRDQTVVFDGVMADGSPNEMPVPYAATEAGLGGNYWVRYGFGGITEMNIHDTSWQRLRELTVRYSLPASVLKNLPFEALSVSFSGRNLWLNTDYPGIDPETNLTGASNGFGLDYFNMPNTKSFGGAINVKF